MNVHDHYCRRMQDVLDEFLAELQATGADYEERCQCALAITSAAFKLATIYFPYAPVAQFEALGLFEHVYATRRPITEVN